MSADVREVPTSAGRTVTVREAGDPSGVPVIVHHGTPGSSLPYEPHIRDAEQKGIRLVSYDRPGYGGSSRHDGRSVADCALDVAAICGALEIDRFCVWGISGGGPHALATAACSPTGSPGCSSASDATCPRAACGRRRTARPSRR